MSLPSTVLPPDPRVSQLPPLLYVLYSKFISEKHMDKGLDETVQLEVQGDLPLPSSSMEVESSLGAPAIASIQVVDVLPSRQSSPMPQKEPAGLPLFFFALVLVLMTPCLFEQMLPCPKVKKRNPHKHYQKRKLPAKLLPQKKLSRKTWRMVKSTIPRVRREPRKQPVLVRT